MAYFQVSDTGIGISNELLPNLFDPVKPENQILEKSNHTRLGLPLAKRMVNLMNGDISAEGNLGKGGSFTVSFPETIDGDRKQKHSEQFNHQVF